MTTCLIVAADDADVIGRADDLPWHLPSDLRRFKELTTGHVMVAGRRTHRSIVDRLGHALPGRCTVVVTSQPQRLSPLDGVVPQPDVESALHAARTIAAFAGDKQMFVIGGAEVYRQALPHVERIYLTRVHDRVAGDKAMPAGWLAGFQLVTEERVLGDALPYSFQTYERP
ncbi:dihydrofolate reductase [Krasilnikovia sp. M28-CT-15]|uniref:dihydrofolate reductase n=1 Tax=Krasilnikovia sp. M28-CT-15 TaxID=3373540 RepID=UPI003876E2FE